MLPSNLKYLKTCAKVVKEILGEDVVCTGCGPANEGYMLINAGVPTICGYASSFFFALLYFYSFLLVFLLVFSFGYEGGHPHAPNEWVDVQSLKNTVIVYSSVIQQYCK